MSDDNTHSDNSQQDDNSVLGDNDQGYEELDLSRIRNAAKNLLKDDTPAPEKITPK